MCKTVVGLNNIAELFENGFAEEENGNDSKTVNKYDIVSIVSYMLGVDDRYLVS